MLPCTCTMYMCEVHVTGDPLRAKSIFHTAHTLQYVKVNYANCTYIFQNKSKYTVSMEFTVCGRQNSTHIAQNISKYKASIQFQIYVKVNYANRTHIFQIKRSTQFQCNLQFAVHTISHTNILNQVFTVLQCNFIQKSKIHTANTLPKI